MAQQLTEREAAPEAPAPRRRRPLWRRPAWVVGHVVCLTLVVLFAYLGTWQLDRHEQKVERRDLVEGRMAASPRPVDEVLAGDPPPAEVAYRRVTVEGRWVPDETLLVRSRSLHGRPGMYVLGLLDRGGGDGLVVVRGFVPTGTWGEDAAREAVTLDGGEARLEGILRLPEERSRFGPRDPAEGRLDTLNRIDVDRIQQQTPGLDLGGVALQQTAPVPEPGAVPEPLPLPATDLGSHRSYMFQWFTFATIGAVGWPLLVRHRTREDAEAARDETGSPAGGSDASARPGQDG